MANKTLQNLGRAVISKHAILDGLLDHAERINNQLERTLQQIEELKLELDAIYELQAESPSDPETQDHPHTQQPLSKLDLEPANHPED